MATALFSLGLISLVLLLGVLQWRISKGTFKLRLTSFWSDRVEPLFRPARVLDARDLVREMAAAAAKTVVVSATGERRHPASIRIKVSTDDFERLTETNHISEVVADTRTLFGRRMQKLEVRQAPVSIAVVASPVERDGRPTAHATRPQMENSPSDVLLSPAPLFAKLAVPALDVDLTKPIPVVRAARDPETPEPQNPAVAGAPGRGVGTDGVFGAELPDGGSSMQPVVTRAPHTRAVKAPRRSSDDPTCPTYRCEARLTPTSDHGVELVVGTGAARPLEIGRGGQLQVDHDEVSWHHASIGFVDGVWFIEDLGSTNGTWVNGKEIGRAPLLPGDEVRLSKTGPNYAFALHPEGAR